MRRLTVCLLLAGVAGCGNEPVQELIQETVANQAAAENQQVSSNQSAVQDEPSEPSGQESVPPAPPEIPIYKAAEAGDLEAVKQHIAAGTDLDQRTPDEQKNTPLMMAALFGRTEIATALMEAGAELDLQNGEGTTALMNAAFMCHGEIVQTLLKNGADKNLGKHDGSTPLQSVEAPFEQVKFIYDLLNELVFQPANMPLDYARIKKTRTSIAEMLGGDGQVDLFTATITGDLEAVKQHIAADTDLNQRTPDEQKNTPLMMAALFGRIEIATALMEAEAELDLQNGEGTTALMNAAFMCHGEIVQTLLKNGADKNLGKHDGSTPLQSVEAPFEQVKFIYDLLNEFIFKPANMPLDYARIKKTRPSIAVILRD